MNATQARRLRYNRGKIKGDYAYEDSASGILRFIYHMIHTRASSGSSHYVYETPVNNERWIPFYSKVMAVVVAELRDNDFTAVFTDDSFGLALRIEW